MFIFIFVFSRLLFSLLLHLLKKKFHLIEFFYVDFNSDENALPLPTTMPRQTQEAEPMQSPPAEYVTNHAFLSSSYIFVSLESPLLNTLFLWTYF